MGIIAWIRDRLFLLGAAILAILAAFGLVYNRGRNDEKAKVETESRKLSEKAHTDAAEIARQVDDLPAPPPGPAEHVDPAAVKTGVADKPATRISDAPSTSAAGKLRDDGWTRD